MKTSKLDQALEHYQQKARRQHTPSAAASSNIGKWLGYTAAASSAFVFSAAADAAVVYSGIQNIGLDTPVDINNDGTNDFVFTISSFNGFSSYGYANLNPLAGAQFIKTNAFDVKKLASGSTISAGAGVFLDIEGTFRYTVIDSIGNFFEQAPWPGAVPPATSSGFAGAKINANGTDIYAWLRFSIENRASNGFPVNVTLIDWAYEDSGAPIVAGNKGVVPLPGSLGLLAMGATGLAAFRRRKAGNKQSA